MGDQNEELAPEILAELKDFTFARFLISCSQECQQESEDTIAPDCKQFLPVEALETYLEPL